ncbi:MAG: hypothetical protein E7256_03400 [Lachnospiraceae bacterium]|nr:hypothetical protein [Lachnospiraceae bacterium]
MRINHNISALKTSNQLTKSNNALSKSLERLSSGYRINHAADDAAGMAISRRMKTQIAGLEQASRNAADGISAIQTAEGALNEISSMLQRMRELSVQAANDTNTIEDRRSIQAEINELNNEINRISASTEFNTKTLLAGDMDKQCYATNSNVNVVSVSDQVAADTYTLSVTQDARQAVATGFSMKAETVADADAGTLVINGVEVEVTAGQTMEQVYENIRNTCETMNIKVFSGTADGDGGYTEVDLKKGTNLVFMSDAYGSSEEIKISTTSNGLAAFLGMRDHTVSAKGVDAEVTLDSGSYTVTATAACDGNKVTITAYNGFEMIVELTGSVAGTTFTDANADGTPASSTTAGEEEVEITVLNAGPLDLQIGANEGQTVEVVIPRIDSSTLGTDSVNVVTGEGAQKAISVLDNAISMVTKFRAKLGAYQNRLEHAIDNLDVSNENITHALSRIEDTDMASEMTKYTQMNVLVQAGTSVLSQANERPQTILSLLQG